MLSSHLYAMWDCSALHRLQLYSHTNRIKGFNAAQLVFLQESISYPSQSYGLAIRECCGLRRCCGIGSILEELACGCLPQSKLRSENLMEKEDLIHRADLAFLPLKKCAITNRLRSY